jgi:hypothetical protein
MKPVVAMKQPYSGGTAAQSLNGSLQGSGQSPVSLKRTGETKYNTKNVTGTENTTRKNIFRIPTYEDRMLYQPAVIPVRRMVWGNNTHVSKSQI